MAGADYLYFLIIKHYATIVVLNTKVWDCDIRILLLTPVNLFSPCKIPETRKQEQLQKKAGESYLGYCPETSG